MRQVAFDRIARTIGIVAASGAAGLLVATSAAAQSKPKKAAEPDPPSDAATNLDYQTRAAAYNRAKAQAAVADRDKRIFEQRAAGFEARARELTASAAAPAPAAAAAGQPAKPAEPGLMERITAKVFGGESEFEKRRRYIDDELKTIRGRMESERQGKSGSGKSGVGPEYKRLEDRQRELEGKLESLGGEERKNSPVRHALEIGLPVAAAVIGGVIGGRMGKSAAKEAAANASQSIAQIQSLAKTARELTKGRGVIAGTPKGDAAKAVVNEAYAIGGAKSAFPSPGYAAPPTAKTVFQNLGAPSAVQYVVPGINVAHGAGSLYASTKVEDDNLRLALRTEGAAAVAAGLFGAKNLVQARAFTPRPPARAIAQIESARVRTMRETASGAGKVGRNRVATDVARSSIPAANAQAAARMNSNSAGVGVNASRAALLQAQAGVKVVSNRSNVVVANSEATLTRARGSAQVEQVRSAKAVRRAAATKSPVREFKRTYKTGPKAGTTEIVKVRR